MALALPVMAALAMPGIGPVSQVDPTLAVMALTLRLDTEAAAADGSLTTVTIGIDDDGQEKFSRRVRLDISPTAREMAQLRWYLEDFPGHPYDPAPTLAQAARTRMRELGAAMHTALRAAGSSPLLDWCLGEGLPETAVEVLGAPGTVAWELLRNPDTGQIPLVHARRMVRLVLTQPSAPVAHLPRAPRMLLVVSRPDGIGDVPFQSVARPLLSALGQAGSFDIEVLRPPSYAALLRLLSAAREAGRPVDLVHFDGHGLVHEGKGHLVFEGEGAGQPGVWIPGARLGRDLAAAGVRMAVLNACRSADVGAGGAGAPIAFRSLAEEIVMAGLGDVLAMQYDVRVDTAARFVAPLYAALGGGHPLGESAMIARKELFATMTVRMAEGASAVTDDWFVPVVYEVQRPRPASASVAPGVGRPSSAGHASGERADIYDAAFYGRDDVLLQLDRAFDTAKIISLHGLAGSGKTAVVRQFGRWYAATGGVPGEVVMTELTRSPSRTVPADPVSTAIGASGAELLGRFAWRPGLLIVDNVELPPSEELTDLLARLTAAGTKVLLTSHLAFELAGVTHIQLGPLTDADMVAVLGDRLGAEPDDRVAQAWRPVLDLANGNPLSLHVLADWCLALPEQSEAALRALTNDVLAGRVPALPTAARPVLETWPQYFLNQPDWRLLAVLLPFQRFASVQELQTLGRPDTPEHLTELEHVTDEQWSQEFLRLSVSGLVSEVRVGYFELHPLFAAALMAGCGGRIEQDWLEAIERSFTFIKGSAGFSIMREYGQGSQRQLSLKWAASEEHNLRHAVDVARRRGWWGRIDPPFDALALHYAATGRLREQAALVDLLAADAVGPDGGPVAGRVVLWADVSQKRQALAMADGDLPTARELAGRVLSHARATGSPLEVARALINLATVEIAMNDPSCADHLTEAGQATDGTAEPDRQILAAMHYHLGMAYQRVTAIGDPGRAYEEYVKSAELQHPDDHTSQAKCLSQCADILLKAHPDDPELAASYLARAAELSATALRMFPREDAANQAIVHARVAEICRMTGRLADALSYDTAARALYEAAGDSYGQASSRLSVAVDLRGLGRLDDSKVYAAAAAQVFAAMGERGRDGAEQASQLLAELGG